jgi:membrane-associated protease RseP (regulator of RpoE activity)
VPAACGVVPLVFLLEPQSLATAVALTTADDIAPTPLDESAARALLAATQTTLAEFATLITHVIPVAVSSASDAGLAAAHAVDAVAQILKDEAAAAAYYAPVGIPAPRASSNPVAAVPTAETTATVTLVRAPEGYGLKLVSGERRSVRVGGVNPSGPAAGTALHVGATVVAINGVSVDFADAVAMLLQGPTLSIEFVPAPNAAAGAGVATTQEAATLESRRRVKLVRAAGESLGMSVRPSLLGGSDVISVTPGGCASVAGVSAGDRIVAINDVDVSTASEAAILAALRESPEEVVLDLA